MQAFSRIPQILWRIHPIRLILMLEEHSKNALQLLTSSGVFSGQPREPDVYVMNLLAGSLVYGEGADTGVYFSQARKWPPSC